MRLRKPLKPSSQAIQRKQFSSPGLKKLTRKIKIKASSQEIEAALKAFKSGSFFDIDSSLIESGEKSLKKMIPNKQEREKMIKEAVSGRTLKPFSEKEDVNAYLLYCAKKYRFERLPEKEKRKLAAAEVKIIKSEMEARRKKLLKKARQKHAAYIKKFKVEAGRTPSKKISQKMFEKICSKEFKGFEKTLTYLKHFLEI